MTCGKNSGTCCCRWCFTPEMAEEAGFFNFDDVAGSISEKLTRRHPHVFADAEAGSAEDQHRAWEEHKAAERAQKGATDISLLASVTQALPALTVASKTAKKAATVGFDWDNPGQVLEKVYEELEELI